MAYLKVSFRLLTVVKFVVSVCRTTWLMVHVVLTVELLAIRASSFWSWLKSEALLSSKLSIFFL